MKNIYLDYAAATPLDLTARAAMERFQTEAFYNPSATYLAGQAVRHDIEAARARIAKWLGARNGEITFTAGGTEANNLAINGVMRQFSDSNIVVSTIEHDSVLVPANDYDCRQVSVGNDGRLNLEALKQAIDDKTVLISVMYANNEIGTIQPLREVAKLVQTVRVQRAAHGSQPLPLYLHTDACQAPNYLDLHVSGLGVDMMTLNAGKIYGPKQCGLLYVRSGLVLEPLVRGGGQELGMRSGTENPGNIAGFAAALDMVQTDRANESRRMSLLQQKFIQLLKSTLPGAIINGSLKHRLPNNIHITMPGHDNERLMMSLDEQGVQCAVGSACSASNEEPSHVLRAIGLSDEAAQSSLRFTMGRHTQDADVERVAQLLAKFSQS